jgi:hypothetical protein
VACKSCLVEGRDRRQGLQEPKFRVRHVDAFP